MPIKVLLDVQLSSADLDASYAAVHSTLEVTRRFDGAISLEVLIDDRDPAKVVVIETWETAAAHDAYTAWRATPEGAPKELAAVLAAPPVTRTFTVASDL